MTDTDYAFFAPAGHVPAPDDVWALAREDYLAGLSAPQVCRRHGLNLATLRSRASREGWRRVDQPWVSPRRDALDPMDEGVQLEARVDGDIEAIEPRQLEHVAEARMYRAVLRGQAAEALRWRRVRDVMRAEQAELDHFIASEEEWAFQHGQRAIADPSSGSFDSSCSSDSSGSFRSDSVFDLDGPDESAVRQNPPRPWPLSRPEG